MEKDINTRTNYSLLKKLSKKKSSKIFSGILTAGISSVFLLLYPIIISKIGLFSFGVWATLNIICSLGYIIDFGIILSVVKLISSKNTNIRQRKAVFSTGLGLLIINILIISSGFFFLKDFFIKILNIQNIEMISTLFNYSIILMVIICLQNYFRLTITGIDKFIVSNTLFSISELIRISLIILNINYLSVEKLILFHIFSLGILILLYLGYVLFNRLLILKFYNREIINQIFNYGKYIVGIRFFDSSFFPMIKIIISHFHGLSFVGIFDLSFKFISFALGIISHSLFFLFPEVSSNDGNQKYVSKFISVTKKLSYTILPLCIIAIALLYLNKDYVSFYLANEVNDLLIFSIIGGLIYMFIECIDKPINFLLYGLDKPEVVLRMRNIQMLLTFPLIFIFRDSFLAIIFILIFCLLLSKTIYIKFFRNLVLN